MPIIALAATWRLRSCFPMMIKFHPQGWEDYQHWQQTDRAILRKIN
ncbi:MAG: type II toxin-antitoxin system YoeB family toxin [Candidatus Contendobacter sp.]|nr:type II toxin-antitoxin system YoeB family toxin [Candidatus Contendobacter sp.]